MLVNRKVSTKPGKAFGTRAGPELDGKKRLTAAIGPTLLTPRSSPRPLDDAGHGSRILPATELNSTSANRLR
jgi:hypothetical protein